MTSSSWPLRLAALALTALLAAPANAQTAPPNQGSIVGVNLGSAEYWTGSQPFWDLMRLSTRFFLQDDTTVNLGPPTDLRPDGYPGSIPAGQRAVTIMDWAGMRREPDWTLLYVGQGEITFGGDAIVTSRAPGRVEVSVVQPRTPGQGIILRILTTDPSDPLRDMRFVPRAIASQFDTPLAVRIGYAFEPRFAQQLDPFSILRFMTWQRTNESPVVNWADRTPVDYQTWDMPSGVPPTIQAGLANRKMAAPWFNMPYMASDDYVTEFARLAAQTLVGELPVYVEEGNEVWNPVVPYKAGKEWAVAQGKLAYPDETWTDHTFAIAWHSLRTTQIGDIWEQAFIENGKDPNRVITVLGAQSSADFTALFGLALDDHYLKIDAIAIAAYVGIKLVSQNPDLLQKTPDQIIDILKAEIPVIMETAVVPHLRIQNYYKNVVQKPIQLLAYEGGVFLQPYLGTQHQELFQQVARHPRMQELILELLNQWNAYTQGSQFLIYNDISNYGVTTEGLRESQYQPVDASPKMKGVRSYIDMHR